MIPTRQAAVADVLWFFESAPGTWAGCLRFPDSPATKLYAIEEPAEVLVIGRARRHDLAEQRKVFDQKLV